MRKLENIRNFDEFLSLNESITSSLAGRKQNTLTEIFRNLGTITFENGETVEAEEIINVVEEAFSELNLERPRTMYFANKTLSIIYLAHSSKYQTMAVDAGMNLYVNAGFVYNNLKMDPELVGAILMHEVYHIVYNHIERSQNWLIAKGKPINNSTWNDTNLAADVEVNQTLVNLGIIDEARLDEIHAIYMKSKSGRKEVWTLEMILNNEEYMNELRKMHPVPFNPEGNDKKDKITTSKDWDNGYKSLWNTLVPLIKKYGWKDIWYKLMENKLINGVGEIQVKDVKDIKKVIEDLSFDPNSMNFLQIKSFDTFINEDKQTNSPGQTFEDGYKTAFAKLVNVIKSVIDGEGGGGGGEGPQGPEIDSELTKDDLEQLNLPDSDDNDDDSNDDKHKGLPQNIKKKANKNKKSKSSNGSDESGDNSNDNDDSQQDDHDKMMKDADEMAGRLRKKMEKGQDGSEGQDNQEGQEGDGSGEGKEKQTSKSGKNQDKKSSGSGNDKEGDEKDMSGRSSGEREISDGSFLNEDQRPDESDLAESGYTEEDIKAINEIRQSMTQKNSPERMKKVLNDYRNQLKTGDYSGKLLKVIDVEEQKYMNIWEKILKKFLSNKTRRAGNKLETGNNDWKNKKLIALGSYGIHRQKQDQDPQDVNLYVDTSGSMDTELLEIIAKSIVILAEQNEFSGLNIACWADKASQVFPIASLYEGSKDQVVSNVMASISLGSKKTGGGTEAKAVLTAILNGIEANLKDPAKEAKDDVHIVITDGYVSGINGIEKDMEDFIYHTFKNRTIASTAPKHTFWMIYDIDEQYRKEWEQQIKKGTLIFINSKFVKNAGKK